MRWLSAFALRRVLAPGLAAGLVLLCLLAARATGGAPLLAGDEQEALALRALARENAWSVLLVAAPFLWLRAATLGTPAAGAWLAPTRARPAARALALGAGCVLAALAAALLAGLVAELALPGAHAGWRRARTVASPGVVLDDAPSVRWSVPGVEPGERLRVWTTVALGSGPATSARLRAHNEAGTAEVGARVAARTALELEPRGPGALELELARDDAGALLVLLPGTEVLAPVPSERLGALALAGRAGLVLATGCLLALALARVLRPALAAAVVLALALAVVTRGAPACAPGAGLGAAWNDLALGLVPAAAPPAEIAGALLLGALALAAHARGAGGPR